MRLLLIVLLALVSSFESTCANAASWVYFDIREPKNQFFLGDRPARSAWMDVAGTALFCGRDDAYQCFKAEGDFQFAVPRDFKGNEKGWTYDGVSYTVAGTTQRYILGRRYLVYFIDRKLGQHRVRFLFSRKVGLIAITTVGASGGMFLILGEKCGYGAPAVCYKPR